MKEFKVFDYIISFHWKSDNDKFWGYEKYPPFFRAIGLGFFHICIYLDD